MTATYEGNSITMATKKKNHSRKALAAALAVMGIAGLSLASAATLTVNTSNEVAIGTGVFASCDTEVDVAYTYDDATFTLEDLSISGIAAACSGEELFFSLENAGGTELATGTATIGGTTATFDISTDSIPVATDLGDIVIVIG